MSDTIERLTSILKSPDSLQADVNPNLNTPISRQLKETLTEIENIGLKLKQTTNLVAKTSQFNQLQIRLLNFLGQLGIELQNSEGQGKQISPEQHAFIKQVIATCIYHQTYLQLLTRNDIINQTYNRISNIQLIKSNQIQDIETLLETASSNTQDFITQVMTTTSTSFGDIHNLDDIIESVRKTISIRPLTQNASYTFIMLTGPPGTGKTSLARAVATYHSEGVYLNLDISALLGQYVGQTEKKIAQLFKYVGEHRNRKFTIIMDELDIVLGDNAQNTAYLTTLRNSLQVALDPEVLGPNLVICGITNYFNQLNDVIKRRATNAFYVPIPTLNESITYFFTEITRPFHTFSFETGSVVTDIISTAYQQQVFSIFESIQNARFTNANMKNIATIAIATTLSNSNNTFIDLINSTANKMIKVCLPSSAVINNILPTRPSTSTDIGSVTQEIHNNQDYFRYIFVIPDEASIRLGINQTSYLTTESENMFRQNNSVNSNNQ